MATSTNPLCAGAAAAHHAHHPKVKILVADDTRMGCQLLAQALSRPHFRFEVTAYAVNSQEILGALQNSRADVALVSQSLEDGPAVGYRVLTEIRKSFPHTRVVMLLKSSSYELVVDAFRGGAKGIFCRADSLEELCKCIRSVHHGQVWANSSQLHFLLEAFMHEGPLRAVDYAGRPLLTPREDEVACLLAEGFSNKAVSAKLGITEHTVSNYLFRIYNKLGVSSRVELVLYLFRQRQNSCATPRQSSFSDALSCAEE